MKKITVLLMSILLLLSACGQAPIAAETETIPQVTQEQKEAPMIPAKAEAVDESTEAGDNAKAAKPAEQMDAPKGADKAVEKQHKLIDRLCSVPILCLDDVGTVTTTQTHLLDAYAIIFDERYKRNLPTIITSNMTHDGLRLAVGSRAADRFLENGRVIVANFDWQGYRTSDDGDGIEFF